MEAAGAARPSFWSRFFGGDRVLWVIIVMLSVASLLVVYSSTASLAYAWKGGNMSYYIMQQMLFLMLGFVAIYVVHRVNYQVYARLAFFAYVVALVLVGLTYVPGVGQTINAASRSLSIPGTGVSVQPADFLRLTLVVVLARQLAKRQSVIAKIPILPPLGIAAWMDNPKKCRDIFFGTTLPLLGPVVVACGALYPSGFSNAAITFLTCFVMLYMGRVRMRELVRLFAIIMVAVALLMTVMAVFDIGRGRTRLNRITDFLDNSTEQVVKKSELTQDMQAKIAIASGGIIGKGPGQSTQRANLPLSFSDFAYAFVAEEYGAVGALVLLMLYLWIFFRGITIFQRCGTAFPSLLVLGLALMIVLQAILNMLVSVSLIPVTGQPLPLVSKGGSSLVFTLVALGMMLGVSRQMKEKTLDRPKGESLLA